jgi:polysaccharide biosynthesis protein PslG
MERSADVGRKGLRRLRKSARVVVVAGIAAALTLQAGSAGANSAVDGRFFGMHVGGLPDAFPQTTLGSVNLTTNGVYWPQLEPLPGVFDFDHLDAVVQAAQAHGAKPLLVLGQTPSFHSTTPGAANVLGSVPDLQAWRVYVWTVVHRYGSSIDYQIWPEPNAAGNFTGSKKDLGRLVAAASHIIHTLAPQAVVVSPALVIRKPAQQRYLDDFFATRVGGTPVGKFVDAVGLDAYALEDGTPEDSYALIQKARRILQAHKVTAPIWNVEMNYGVVGGFTFTPYRYSARKQASYVVRNDVLDAAAGVERVQWLGWFPFPQAAIQFVQTDRTTPTPAAAALDLARSWLIHQHVRSCAADRKTHVWTCRLTRAGHESWIYWVPKGSRHIVAPRGSRHVQTVTGAVTGTSAGRRIVVTSAPIRVYH